MSSHQPSRSKLKRDLYKLVVARSDIAGALETCELILKRVGGMSDKLYVPLFHAAVIAYARPFVDNKSTGVLPRQWSEFQDSRLNNSHKALLKTRHQIVAHSDSSIRSVKIVPPNCQFAEGISPSKHIALIVNSYYQPKQFFIDTRDTCITLIERFTVRIEELLVQLYEQRELPSQPFDLNSDELL